MLGRLFDLISPKKRRARARRLLAERILISVEQLGAMCFDNKTLAEMGLSRKLGMRIICILLLRERIHMMTDGYGRVILLSNQEFERFTRQRADNAEEPEIRVRSSVKSMVVQDSDLQNENGVNLILGSAAATMRLPHTPPQPSAADSETRRIPAAASAAGEESEAVLFTSPPITGNEEDYEWFDIDVASRKDASDPSAAKKASERQSLPERKREPWLSARNIRKGKK